MTADTAKPTQEKSPFSTALVSAVYFGLALLYFLPAFLPLRHIYGSDYFAAGYFSHEFISERLAAGELPAWVPYVYGGLPLFSNPGSTFYPLRWIADLVFPVSKIYPTMFVFQFGMAGLGAFLLTRELGARRWIAFVAGIAFQFTGLTMSYVLAGHDGRIIVATLAPLLFFFLHRGVRTGEVASFVGAAATVGFVLLSFQIQSAYYLLLGGAIWAVFCLIHHRVHRTPAVLGRRIAMGLGAVAVGFALAAPNFLPFLDYVEKSPRGAAEGRGYEYSVSWSMPPDEILGLAVPEETGGAVYGYFRPGQDPATYPNPFKLHTEYAGAFVLALFVLGFGFSRRDPRFWFFIGLSIFALTIAFGGHTPVYRIWYELLPGTKRFRAPSISFFLVSMSLVVMAALAMEAIAARLDVGRSGRRAAAGGEAAVPHIGRWLLGIGGAALLGLILAAAGQDGTEAGAAIVRGWFRFAIFLAVVLGLVWAWVRGALAPTVVALALAATTLVDLWIVDRRFFETRPPPDETFAADDVVDFLRSQPGPYRVWVLPLGQASYPREANYLMRFGIEQAGGEHGNQLQRWNEFVGAGERTYVDWHNFLQTSSFLDAANVRYVISGAPLQGVPFPLVHRGPGGVVYENPAALPRAWLVGETVAAAEGTEIETMRRPDFDFRTTAVIAEPLEAPLPAGPLEGDARVLEHSPDRVVVEATASRDALLVLADNWYPDWSVTIDGADAPLHRVDHTFRGVRVPAGTHRVVFTFDPADLRLGFAIWLAGLALLAGYAAWFVWRRRHGPSHPAGVTAT